MADHARRLEENLSLLAAVDPLLATAVRQAPADPRFVFLTSRSGADVPALRTRTGTVPLHSRYDPRQEGERLAESVRGSGCVVAVGLGGGFHLHAMLRDRSLQALLVMEKDAPVLRALFEGIDLSPLLRDPRLTLISGWAGLSRALAVAWKPALAGGLKTMCLRSWRDLEPEFCQSAMDRAELAVEDVRADYSVQAHFGKRWAANILSNLPRLNPAPRPPAAEAALVTGAGPSLDIQAPRLQSRRKGSFLLATDTSLPALLGRGICPDGVISIDCQAYSYHHFMHGLPAGTALFLDLASPPLLARRHGSPVYFAGGHPLARYINSRWTPLPFVDTSGGNVTHAAVTLARVLGAADITVFGADFSYPSGKAYARGTYLYDFFGSTDNRLAPAHSRLLSFALGQVVHAGKPTTALLLSYRERFQRLMADIDARVVAAEGLGLPLEPTPGDASRGRAVMPAWPTFSAPAEDWKGFLADYRARLAALPDRCASGAEIELRDTVLPVAATVVKEGAAPGAPALEAARRWMLERIDRTLRGS